MIAEMAKHNGGKHRNWTDILIMTGMVVNGIVILMLLYYYFFGR
ncbi:MAG: hypothetical protein OEV28_09850 [Nitrospirota bacterium]|nr:hypothetical protein [Nitrospirota bacterium]